MGWLDFTEKGIKALAQMPQAEIIERYIQTSKENLKLQSHIEVLEKDNRSLREQVELKSKIIRTPDGYFTLQGDNPNIRYCTHCWDANHLTIQVCKDATSGSFFCPKCTTTGVYDIQQFKKSCAEHHAEIVKRKNFF